MTPFQTLDSFQVPDDRLNGVSAIEKLLFFILQAPELASELDVRIDIVHAPSETRLY